MVNLSKEHLTKLVLHTTAVNSILTKALLSASETEPEADTTGTEVEIDVLVIDPGAMRGEEQQIPAPQALNLDALCGEWKSGRRKADLMIFKAAPGYMAAWGKKPKKDETGDCYLITEVNGNPCVSMGSGFVYLSYDSETDTLNVHPGGEYKRVPTDSK